jgi:hypothetical protein
MCRGLGGCDAKDARVRGNSLNLQRVQEAGDGNLPCALIVDHDAPLAGRAAARDDAIFAE